MKNVKLYSYNPVSNAGRELASGLGIKRVMHEGSKFVAKPRNTVINWGASTLPVALLGGKLLNPPEEVGKCSNKLMFFNLLKDTELTPKFTTSQDTAIEWCREGKVVVCRQKLTGHSGEGIVIAETEQDIVPSPLYVLYVKKKDEYRVHVFNGKSIDVQRKARRLDCEEPNWRVRNYDNGFIYARDGLVAPSSVTEVAVKAMGKTKLNFGAVDVLFNDKKDRAVVLEVNTAPGLVGTTLTNYIGAFREFLS